MRTQCSSCVFAVSENRVQLGCKFDRLDKFPSKELQQYKDGSMFYIVEGLCNACRSTSEIDVDIDIAKQIVEEEIKPTIDVVVIASDIEHTESAIKQFEDMPCGRIIIAARDMSTDFGYLTSSKVCASYYIHHQDDHENKFLDNSAEFCKSRYLMFVDSHEPIKQSKNLYNRMNSWVNEKMLNPVLIHNGTSHEMLIAKWVFNQLGGFKTHNLSQILSGEIEISNKSGVFKWNELQ